MMMEMTAVVSVKIEGGRYLMQRRAVRVKGDQTFGQVYRSLQPHMTSCDPLPLSPTTLVVTAFISKLSNPTGAIQVDMNMQCAMLFDFECNCIEYIVQSVPDTTVQSRTSNNAFQKLMRANANTLPDKIKGDRVLTAPEHLYNDLIDFCGYLGSGWSKQNMAAGVDTIKALRNMLWYIDHAHEKFKENSCTIPEKLQKFQGYNQYKKHRHNMPVIKASRLNELCQSLARVMSLPCNQSTQSNTKLTKLIDELLECTHKYMTRLEINNEAHQKEYHRRLEVARSPDVNSSCKYIKCSKTPIPTWYKKLDEHVKNLPKYAIIDLQVHHDVPSDRYTRRKWLQDIELSHDIMLYQMAYGNSIGTLSFIWSVPDTQSPERETMNAKNISAINSELPKFSSRDMRKQFIELYCSNIKTSKSILRHMYRELTGDSSASGSSEQSEIDERVASILLGSDDPELLIDYRGLNGCPGETKFQVFYDECAKYFEEQLSPVVNDRRHRNTLYMPLAISIEDLRAQVKKRLPQGTPVPSNELLRLQFYPSSVYKNTALKHSGRFDIKFKVQSRLIHADHPDSKYVYIQYTYMKEMACKYREQSVFVCLDDKATIPVGEPEIPISTGVRGHNRVLAPVFGDFSTTDHDFHKGAIVPSVILDVTIPENAADSFFQGKIHVSLKDKVFQPSSPIRHATELIKTLRDEKSSDGISLCKPILFMFTDGGPDHRVTFDTVKLSLLTLFIQFDLDMLVALRTAPHHSWVNPAERCMSILNLALQHVSLSREKMEDQFELKIRSLNSLVAMRNYAKRSQNFKAAFATSMEQVVETVGNRVGHMTLKGEQISVHRAASDEEITEAMSPVKLVLQDEGIEPNLDTKSLKAHKKFYDFIESHGKSNHYTFQLKKCKSNECAYCILNPTRLDDDIASMLYFLPDPMPNESGDHYKTFHEVYGTETSDAHRPSNTPLTVDSQEDKNNKKLLVASKVRAVIFCGECAKPRCIFSATQLTPAQANAVVRTKEDSTYLCGRSLFPEDHQFVSTVVVRRSQSCHDTVEATYYSSTTVHFAECCVHCGSLENLLEDDYMKEMKSQFAVVRPLCGVCRNKGKEAKTWGLNKLNKGKRSKKH